MFVGPVVFVLWVFCFVQAVTSRPDQVRNLPKLAWILLVLFFPLIGSVAWLVAGRPVSARPRRSAYERPATAFPEYDRPGRAAALDPETDEEFLRRCRERAEEQRRRAREQGQRPEERRPEEKRPEEQPGEG